MPAGAQPGDAELIARSADGDRQAFDEVIRRHGDALLRFSRFLTGDDSLAEDVSQETFIAAYRHASSYRADASLRSWLYAIARNTAHRQHRRRRPEPMKDESLEQLGLEAGWGALEGPERATEVSERRQQLAEALSTLSDEDREVILLRDVEGLSGTETATLLGITLVAMKARLHRARLRLMAAARGGASHEGT